jgi:hypothetical protein
MLNCQKIKYCASEILNHIKSKKVVSKKNEAKIVFLLSKYIDKLIFNFVAIAALISLKAGVRKILDKHMVFLSKYITTLCFNKKGCMKGGAFNTLAFFGGDEPMYRQDNEGDNVMEANLKNGIVRPELFLSGMQTQEGGGKSTKNIRTPGLYKLVKCKKVSAIIKVKLANVFKFFKVKITKTSINVISKKIETFLNTFIIKLIKSKGKELTISGVKKIMVQNKIIKK